MAATYECAYFSGCAELNRLNRAIHEQYQMLVINI